MFDVRFLSKPAQCLGLGCPESAHGGGLKRRYDDQCPGAAGWRRTLLSGRGCRLTLLGHDGDGGQQIDDGPALY